MIVTLFTFLTSAFVGSLFILLVVFLCRQSKFILHHGISFLSYLLIASIIRLIFVIEFPFTRVFHLPFPIANITHKLYTVSLSIFGLSGTIISFIVLIWLIVTISLFLRNVISLIKNFYWIRKLPTTKSKKMYLPLKRAIRKIYNETQIEIQKIRILQNGQINEPMVIGFFRPTILLPLDIDFTDEELYIIFLHELSHFKNKDTIVVCCMELTASLYWWFPLVHFLRFNLNHVLELRCDTYVTSQLPNKYRRTYLEILVKICKHKNQNNIPFFALGIAPKRGFQKSFILQRAEIISKYKPISRRKTFLIRIGHFLLSICLLLSSFVFVFQPVLDISSDVLEEYVNENGAKEHISENSSYIVKHEDETWSLYVDNNFYMSLDEQLKNELIQDLNLKIYTEDER